MPILVVLLIVLALVRLAGVASAEPAVTPTLAEALAVITSKRKVDLTHAFDATTPVSPRFGQARMTPAVDPRTLEAYTIAASGFRATYYAMVGQYGTHVDPPAEVAPTGSTLEDIPLDAMILPLVVLDDTPYLAADPAHAFSLADLAAWEQRNGPVRKGAFVALRTDLSKAWTSDPERFRRGPLPTWSLPVLKVLFEQRGIVAIGHESLEAIGHESLEADMPGGSTCERYVLGGGHYAIAAMDGLDALPATGAVIVATWPKVKNGFGFPARAFAILP